MAGPKKSCRSSGPSTGVQFILSSNGELADPAIRKLIRSHVMRGRKLINKGLDRNQRTNNLQTAAVRSHPVQVNLTEVIEDYTPLVPRVGSDLSFVEVADDIEPSVLLRVTKVSPAANRVIFPLMAALSFKKDERDWLYLVGSDAAALHITVFAVESFIDRVFHRQENSLNIVARLHLQKGLKLLRKRLLGEDDDIKVSDFTLGVVVKLASAAHFDGDYLAAKHHMDGLRRMVGIRGGIEAFRNRHLGVEMIRCDLSITILNGSDPVFYCQPTEPFINYPEKLFSAPKNHLYLEESIQSIQGMDDGLVVAWQIMKRFCFMVNLGTQTNQLIHPEIISETMTAIIYRLLNMHFAAGSIVEALRLGLLTFSYHVFLQWQDIKLPYQFLPNSYRDSLSALKRINGVSSELILWLLMTGANSLFEVSNDSWLGLDLREYAERCQVRTWKKMQDILKSFMWIEWLDEQSGKRIYDLLAHR